MDLKSSNKKGGSQSPLEFNKKAIITASVIVGVLLVVGVSYGVYYKMSGTSKKADKQTTKTNTNQASSTNTNTSKTQDTSGWKTCNNKSFGYQVNYPADWKIFLGSGGPSAMEPVSGCEGQNIVVFASQDIFGPLSQASALKFLEIDISDQERLNETIYKGSETLDEYFGKNPLILKNNPIIKESTINGERAVWLSDFPSPWIMFFHNDSFFWVKGKNISPELLDDFLSNFKFTNTAVGTSDWKTYQNTENGFEIKYPKNFIYREEETSSYAIGAFFTGQEDSSPVKVSATLELPDSVYPNTNFHSAIVTLASAPAITTLSQCQNFMSNGKEKILQNKAVINNTTFYQGETGGAAAGTAFHNKINHAFHNGTCFEVGLTLVSSDIGLYPDTYKEVNKDEVWNTLENIFSTFTFIK